MNTYGYGTTTIAPASMARTAASHQRQTQKHRPTNGRLRLQSLRLQSTHQPDDGVVPVVSPRQQILNRFDAGFYCDSSSPTTPTSSTPTSSTPTTPIAAAAAMHQQHPTASNHANESNHTANSNCTTNNTEHDHRRHAARTALIDTLDWLENVVIGYNLCPFAEAPMLRSELAIEVVLGTDQTEILATVLGECLGLHSSRSSNKNSNSNNNNKNHSNNDNDVDDSHNTNGTNVRGTALVVCPDLCPTNFLAYLEVYNVLIEGLLPDHDLDDELQIAPFHPLFVFGENELVPHAIDNYTNRSPHPTFHVLREAEVEKAVAALDGNAEKVWKRNVDVLQAMEDLFLAPPPSPSQKDNGKDNDGDGDGYGDSTFQEENSALLRSIFLKGKANRTSAAAAAAASTTSTSNSSRSTINDSPGCPIAKQIDTVATATATSIEKYQDQIKRLLREFRKKSY
jgi:hypothetical protein